LFEALRKKGFDILALHHAEEILTHDMPAAIRDLEDALGDVSVTAEELVRGGGGEGALTQRLRKRLNTALGWKKHNFEVKKIVDGVEKESISHEIDHVKVFNGSTFALEIEWNNKDPFYDRDLENYKRLHADGVISIGGIITRGRSLHDAMRGVVEQFAAKAKINTFERIAQYYQPTKRQIEQIERAIDQRGSFEKGWAHAFCGDKFGESTTHWRKLEDRVHRGVGNPCPLILIGLPAAIVQL